MAGGSGALTLLTVFGVVSFVSGVIVRAVALRRALLFAPAPVPAGVRPVPSPVTPRFGPRSADTLRRVPAGTPTRRRGLSRPAAPAPPRIRRRLVTEDRLLFLACFMLYLACGAVLAFNFDSFNGDAQARVANAFYVLFSRDPHLAAIGFVWSPLPSFLLLPVLPLKVLWPALVTRAFAGIIEIALCMAGAVCVLHGILRDLRLSRPVGLLITALFALNPMVVYHGANGMSEAMFLFTLLLATRHLMRWLATGSLRALALAGVWLGVAYLTRNEALAAGAATILLVTGRTYLGTTSPHRQRLLAGLADGIIVGAPIATTFVAWAAAAYIITGHPFQQISANASQVVLFGTEGLGMSRTAYIGLQILSYAPLLPLIALFAGYRAWRCRDWRALAPAAVLGGVLAFAVFVFLTGQTFGWLRFTIAAVPLAAILSGWLLTGEGTRSGSRRTSRRLDRLRQFVDRRFIRSALAGAVATILLAPSLPATAWAMSDRHLGREEQLHLAWVLHGVRTKVDRRERDRFRTVQNMAKYLDRMHLPDGSIMVDPVTPCISWLILASRHPRQFVIPNDRDFEALLADPQAFNVRYLLPPSPQDGLSVFDVINRTYPGLYERGASLAELAHEFTNPACPRFRLYRVTKPTADQPGQTMPTGRGG